MENNKNANKIYNGNLDWVLEALKTVNKEVNFDFNFKDVSSKTNEILLYDSLVFSNDKEDSLFFQIEDNLYEYFSNDKSELILKLIKLFEKKNPDREQMEMKFRLSMLNSKQIIDSKSPGSTSRRSIISNEKEYYNNNETVDTPESKNRTQLNSMKSVLNPSASKFLTKKSTQVNKSMRNSSSLKNLNSDIVANLYLVYKDNSVKWIYNYEIKKLLFYLKFLPDFRKLKIIRLFPSYIKSFKIKSQTYIDKEDEFSETKEQENYKKYRAITKTPEEEMFDNLVAKLKHIFYEKYSLLLRKLDIDTFTMNNNCYLLDVKEIVFEKFDNKHIKLISERLLQNFQEKYKYKNMKMNREAPNHKEIKSLFFSMLDVYDKTKKAQNLDKYLHTTSKDPTTNNIFKVLKPDAPYTFSELLENNVSKKEFAKYASNKLWNL
jgi:hypothetical protein